MKVMELLESKATDKEIENAVVSGLKARYKKLTDDDIYFYRNQDFFQIQITTQTPGKALMAALDKIAAPFGLKSDWEDRDAGMSYLSLDTIEKVDARLAKRAAYDAANGLK